MSLEVVQGHALSRVLALPARAPDLQRELRNVLCQASNTKRLRTPPRESYQLVTVLPEPPPNVAAQLVERGLRGNAYCIVGGDKNQERDRSLRHFTRDDDAWFDFTITVRENAQRLELLAYDFEIRFPPGTGTPFLRFDLNLPAHRNEDRELRSHMHAGSDDVLVPAPLMSPTELLVLFLDGLRLSADREKPRTRTPFEVNWLRETHAMCAVR